MKRGDAFKEGVTLLLDKPVNWTSFDVVKKTRSIILKAMWKVCDQSILVMIYIKHLDKIDSAPAKCNHHESIRWPLLEPNGYGQTKKS